MPLQLNPKHVTVSKVSESKLRLTCVANTTAPFLPGVQETLDDLENLKVSPHSSNASSSTRKKGRKISAKCWMAQKFPMSLRQLLPVMDVIGHANKHLGRMAKFLRKYGDMELFPVKLQVRHLHVSAV